MSTPDDICRTCGKPGAVEMRCRRLPCIWADTVAAAFELDMTTVPGSNQTGPKVIEAVIVATHDRMPGGSQSSESGVRASRMESCEDRTCPGWHPDFRHDHPVPVDPTGDAAMRPSRSEADLAALRDAVSAFVTSVGHLVALSVSDAPRASWDAAIADAVMLDEMGAIEVLESNGGSPRRWVIKAGDAIDDLQRIRDRHCTRKANDWERSWTSGLADDQCCRVCFQLGLRVSRENGSAELCQTCMRLRNKCADVNDVDNADVPNPPPALVEELRRIGAANSPADRAARSRWYQRVGDDIKGRRSA